MYRKKPKNIEMNICVSCKQRLILMYYSLKIYCSAFKWCIWKKLNSMENNRLKSRIWYGTCRIIKVWIQRKLNRDHRNVSSAWFCMV